VNRDYDLFEILPDGSPIWKELVSGLTEAIRKLEELGKQTKNEVRLMHVPTNTIIATVNTPEP
jgi:hypothetical protein